MTPIETELEDEMAPHGRCRRCKSALEGDEFYPDLCLGCDLIEMEQELEDDE